MPAHRLTMRKTREILRLKWGLGRSGREVARSCKVSPSTVTDLLGRAAVAGLSWPLPEELDDAALEALLYPPPSASTDRAVPDFATVYRELKSKGVTLMLLWQEYKAQYVQDGYQYSQYCQLYRHWRGQLDLVMRQEHRAGEKMFVDYAGPSVEVIDTDTGEVTEAAIFVAALGASSNTYAEAQTGQDLRNWIGGNIRALEFFQGVPDVIVPDNLKSGVKHACYYDPEINPTYKEMAEHYDTAIIPARKRRPKDKAKVENAVQQVERWVLAPLRKRTFHSLAELNEAIRERLHWLNNRPFSKLNGCRRSLWEELDRPALKPLPKRRYVIAEWKANAGVNIDYHVEFDRHFYSVPFHLVRKRVDVRGTSTTVEVLYKGRRVAAHLRSYQRGRFTTDESHRPKSHQRSEWNPGRLIRWAAKTGPNAEFVVKSILESKPHPEQGFRACLGILRLGKRYGNERLERACERARVIRSASYRSINSILKTGLDREPLQQPTNAELSVDHDNIRGPAYYH